MSPFRTVAKVGGSWLAHPQVVEILGGWLEKQPAGPILLFVGGGELVEQLRTYDHRFALGEALSHRLALSLLDVTAELLATILKLPLVAWPPRGDWSETTAATAVFQPHAWLRFHEEQPAPPWPRTWQTTSDSLAAVLAAELDADLILLKSRPAEATNYVNSATREQIQSWAATGFVDPYFPIATQGVRSVRIEVPGSFPLSTTQHA